MGRVRPALKPATATSPGADNNGMARPAAVVAVLADIHGNLPALNAVLGEPGVAAADAVVLLGDIALGPMPAASALLRRRPGHARGRRSA